jgi:hypothetical protein
VANHSADNTTTIEEVLTPKLRTSHRRKTDNPALIALLVLAKIFGGGVVAIIGLIALMAACILLTILSASATLLFIPLYLLL